MASRTPSPGIVVDNKYRLAERIGGGGMGYVFRAENVLAGRAVAIKFLHPELSENSELAQRFFQEAQAVNKIRHPNIVDVIDAGVGEFGPYIVMEHLEGEGVGSALTRLGRFDMECSLSTAIPVLEALDAAHRVGIIHRGQMRFEGSLAELRGLVRRVRLPAGAEFAPPPEFELWRDEEIDGVRTLALRAEPAAWDALALPPDAAFAEMSLEDRFIACVGSTVVRI